MEQYTFSDQILYADQRRLKPILRNRNMAKSMNTLFITGSSGFIGSHLLCRINTENYKNIYCLSRTKSCVASNQLKCENIKFIQGDLFDINSYGPYLSQSDIVIHLGAATGKKKAEKYFDVNANGTDLLLKQCLKAGIRKFLYISSIAVKFKDIKNYPYAQSKLQAEKFVTASGMLYTILRPTIVIGDGSPFLMSLLKIAKVPIIPIFGDGSAMVQPIFIEDLISHIIHIVKKDVFNNEILDLGGPEKISIANFIKILHKLTFNKNPRFFHVPIHPVVMTLKFMEKYLFTFLPLTAGQLSSFSNHGTIDRNWLFDRYRLNMKNVDEMLQFVISPAMKIGKSKKKLKQECTRFTEYLVNCKPNEYIEKKYLEGHNCNRIGNNMGLFDTFLTKAANRNSIMTRLADTYTAVFYRKAVLRKKLVLLLAVLESSSTTHSKVDSISENSRLTLLSQIIQKNLVFLLLLLLSSFVFFPIRTMCYFFSIQPRNIL